MKKEIFIERRRKLGDKIEDNSMMILFAGQAPYKSADEVYKFTPNRNFYYMTGIDRDKIILVITKLNGKLSESLFIEESDPVMAKWVGDTIGEQECKDISGIENIMFLKDFVDTMGGYLNRTKIDKLYLDLERQEYNIMETKAQEFALDLSKRYPYIKIHNIYHTICEFRTIKEPEEIEEIKKAIDITYEGIKEMWRYAKPSMTEYEIEAYFDFILKKNGVKDYAFTTIAASGKNATVLHYGDNNCKIKDGDLMLLDLGAQYNYYNADISRTFPVNGKFTERQKEIYNIVLEANEKINDIIKPGMTLKELNDVAKKVLSNGCKRIGLIKDDNEISKYYYHGVGHLLGLDTHDVGARDIVLKPGMVLTNEPGLYIEEEGIGIRIEDDVLVTADGNINLSSHVIKSVEDIEKFFKENNI